MAPTPHRTYRAAALALLGLILIALASVQLRGAASGVSEEPMVIGGTPVTLFRPAEHSSALPAVLISHGFAGSQQLMRSFALTLAQRGYLAVTFDYLGHGRHPEALSGDVTKIEGATQKLLEQTVEVADRVLELPDASGELAVLGHSMASDIVVRFANADPRVMATVAVSMFSTAVSAESPRNLLVIVGGWEGFLKNEALRVLGLVTDTPRAGVTVGSIEEGSARRVAIAEGVEHVGVLYDVAAQREAADWLDAVFGRSRGDAIAERGPAIIALLLGLVLLAWPLAQLLPKVSEPARGASLRWRELLPAALVPAIGTPLLLVAFPADFMGVLVGGYLAVHFLVYGLLAGAMLWWLARRRGDATRASTPLPRVRLAAATLAATLFFAGVFAWVLDSTVTSYAITATRLPLVLATLVGTLAFFLADEWMAHGAYTARGGHLFTRFCFLLSLGIAVALSFEELFFLLIIAAVIVIYFLVYGLFSRWVYARTGHPAVGAIANAVSFAWALGAV
ncbi:MAG: alpha/beta fold hydrolase, partial [Halieaceae bacterium]|nr:alpha/beta fold hydrolase [Halieaceae bacterium]